MRRPNPRAVRWAILLTMLVLWEVVPMMGLLPELFLPPLSKTLKVLWLDLDKYFAALLVTLYEVAVAMLIACGLGIVAGATIGGISVLQLNLQAAGSRIPVEYLSMSPYLITILVLVIMSSGRGKASLNAPAALGRNFHASR